MATDVIMPQMGESIAEGTITRWLVKEGDPVERDQPLFEISTDKVDAEIPSPASGTLLEILCQEGETVEVNEVVARIGEAGEKTEEREEATRAEDETREESKAAEPEEKEDEEAGTEEPVAGDSEETPAAAAAPADEDEATRDRVRTFSSPVVRKMAADKKVDLSRVEGTGIHGRVTKRDLEAYLARRAEAAPERKAKEAEVVPAHRREPGEFSVAPYTEGDNVEIEPMSKIRQLTAAHMVYSKATSAHVTTVFHMDMTRVARARDRAKREFAREHGTKLTYMPFIFKAVAGALKKHRKLNAAVDGSDIVYKKDVHLGMAVALDWGLLVPVIRHADQLSLVGLAKTANDLAERARAKRLSPDEVQGGTFTVTNPGVFGSLIGTPIINQPQVAILGIGVIEKRPIVQTSEEGVDSLAIRTMSYFSISYDHRLVDGADADHFMNEVKRSFDEDRWMELEAFSGR